MAGLILLPRLLVGIIDNVHTSGEEKAKARLDERKLDLQFARLEDAGDARQVAVLTCRRQNTAPMFVAGWRPFVGWISAVGFGIHVIVIPIAEIAASLWLPEIEMPEFDTVLILTILGGMLGIGKSLRSYEKAKGVAQNRIRAPKVQGQN